MDKENFITSFLVVWIVQKETNYSGFVKKRKKKKKKKKVRAPDRFSYT